MGGVVPSTLKSLYIKEAKPMALITCRVLETMPAERGAIFLAWACEISLLGCGGKLCTHPGFQGFRQADLVDYDRNT